MDSEPIAAAGAAVDSGSQGNGDGSYLVIKNARIAADPPSSDADHDKVAERLYNVVYRHRIAERSRSVEIELRRAPHEVEEAQFDPSAPLSSTSGHRELPPSSSSSSADAELGTLLSSATLSVPLPLSESPSLSTVTRDEIDARGSLLIPGGLCHPHVHIDKCFLLSRCGVEEGTFDEALKKTAQVKREFMEEDLLQRGRRLVATSISHGVTAMRAHVEVDPTVNHTCLLVGLQLKQEFADRCTITLVAFAQDPLFPLSASDRSSMHSLLRSAASMRGVDAVGSAPYVEPVPTAGDGETAKRQVEKQRRNVDLIFSIARTEGKDVDFHLDYDLAPPREGGTSLIPYVLVKMLRDEGAWDVPLSPYCGDDEPASALSNATRQQRRRRRRRRVTLGHCTKLSVFSDDDIEEVFALLRRIQTDDDAAGNEEGSVHFVSLPPSDLYMQGRGTTYATRSRATLPALELLEHTSNRRSSRPTPPDDRGAVADDGIFNVSMGVNNVANLFTPQGDADPLALLPTMVGVWQRSTPAHCRTLLHMVAGGARAAAGLSGARPRTDGVHAHDLLDATLLDGCGGIEDAVFAPPAGRTTVKAGRVVARRTMRSWVATE